MIEHEQEYLKASNEALRKEVIRLNDELAYCLSTFRDIEQSVARRQANTIATDPNFLKPLSEIETNYETANNPVFQEPIIKTNYE